jgi:hypothetical protein
MVPDRDYYADKDGKLTDDPEKYARQIGVKGFFLDDGVARRYGISDTLVSTDEPNAPRRVTGRSNEASVEISKADEDTQEPQEPVVADEPQAEEPEAEKPKAETAKPAAKKGEKKK